jgi:hypothetical protein
MGGATVTVEWGDYHPYQPIVAKPLHEATRKEAREEFDKRMAEKPQRIEALRELLRLNSVELQPSDEGIQKLNDWFAREVEPNPEQQGRLQSIWYAVINDMALFLGDVMIDRSPNLQWVMFDKGKKDVSFQRHVIMGFSKVPNPKYNVDVDLILSTYGHRIIGGNDVESDEFVAVVREAQEDA